MLIKLASLSKTVPAVYSLKHITQAVYGDFSTGDSRNYNETQVRLASLLIRESHHTVRFPS